MTDVIYDLLGSADPLSVTHKLTIQPSNSAKTWKHPINAFRYFKQSSHGLVIDVCSIALEKKTSLVIVHFHKRFQASMKLTNWNEDKDLDTISSLLASASFRGTTTIFVVQQHANVVNEGHGSSGSNCGVGICTGYVSDVNMHGSSRRMLT
ncbi:hypothetical protein Peur_038398 [Populus x canadensis]